MTEINGKIGNLIATNIDKYKFSPKTNIKETKNSFIIELSMPGTNKEQIELNVEGDFLQINGKLSGEDYEHLRPVHSEYRLGGYEKSFKLGKSVNTDEINAIYQRGVMTINLPKRSESIAKTIKVD